MWSDSGRARRRPGCINALERGRSWGWRRIFHLGKRAPVKMFGTSAHLPLGPWGIAARAGAAVLPGFVLRVRPRRYRIFFMIRFCRSKGQLRHQMETMQRALSEAIWSHTSKAYPEQWDVAAVLGQTRARLGATRGIPTSDRGDPLRVCLSWKSEPRE